MTRAFEPSDFLIHIQDGLLQTDPVLSIILRLLVISQDVPEGLGLGIFFSPITSWDRDFCLLSGWTGHQVVPSSFEDWDSPWHSHHPGFSLSGDGGYSVHVFVCW